MNTFEYIELDADAVPHCAFITNSFATVVLNVVVFSLTKLYVSKMKLNKLRLY